MSLKIIESDEALADVIRIADYLAEHAGLNTADRFLECDQARLQAACSYARHGAFA